MGCKDININAVKPIDDLNCELLIPTDIPIENNCDMFETQLTDLESRFDICPKNLSVEDFQKLISYLSGFVNQFCYNDLVYKDVIEAVIETLKCLNQEVKNIHDIIEEIQREIETLTKKIEECCEGKECVGPTCMFSDVVYYDGRMHAPGVGGHEPDDPLLYPPFRDAKVYVDFVVNLTNNNIRNLIYPENPLPEGRVLMCALIDPAGNVMKGSFNYVNTVYFHGFVTPGGNNNGIMLIPEYELDGIYKIVIYGGINCNDTSTIVITKAIVDEFCATGDESILNKIGITQLGYHSFEVIHDKVTMSYSINVYPATNVPPADIVNKGSQYKMSETIPQLIPPERGVFIKWYDPNDRTTWAPGKNHGIANKNIVFYDEEDSWEIFGHQLIYDLSEVDSYEVEDGHTPAGFYPEATDINVFFSYLTSSVGEFSHWKINDVDTYNDMQFIMPMPNSDLTIKPVFIKRFDVAYDPNGTGVTNMPLDSSVIGGSSYTIPSGIPVRNGYNFLYYVASGSISGQYSPGSVISNVSGNILFTAYWTVVEEYSLVYDANGGTAAPVDPNSPYREGDIVTILPYS